MGHAKLTGKDSQKAWPAFLKKLSEKTDVLQDDDEPILIDMRKKNADKELEKLVKDKKISQIADNYDEQYAELLLSRDAHLYRANEAVQKHSIKEHLKKHYGGNEPWKLGSWVYYPWNQKLVHILSQEDFEDLRTVRNRELITKEEQAILADFNVACLGMSVGSSSAISIILSGISRRIKLADGAVISGSNLNRILAKVSDIGQKKDIVVARILYEMNPYIQVQRMPTKVTKENLKDLFDSKWKLDAVVDEIDDLEMKIRVRIEARKRGIPVIMATELADDVMLDIERFDIDKNRPLFHGLAGNIEEVLNNKDMNHRQWMKHATTIIGPKNVPLNMQQSLLKIGSTVVTHPQLGSTVMITGGVLAFAVKQLALGNTLESQRTLISLEKSFLKDKKTLKHRRAHKKHTKVLHKAMKAMK